ncbi:hypothetical protein PIB30_005650 [Stylosanthes scabra]|uniref:Retrotransposon Copia-like N-terminal domain-containing protein n=1 Tax=Stylosanthes scabra TaxID=79078 RepID=A0ABU6T5Z9_9FABA|nr:hypothetical protein [Stylosanthes scabra]
MALIVFSQLNLKNALVPLSDKLDENNLYSWQKSVMLTLKLIDQILYDKAPPQFAYVHATNDDSDSVSKITGDGATPAASVKKASKSPVLQESAKYADWIQNDCALMTWLDASMSLSYKNKVVHCTSFGEAWETIQHIFTASSNTRIQSIKTQLKVTKKSGTIREYLQSI